MSTVLQRFLRYVTYDTRSDDSNTASPSTPAQLVLLRLLAGELTAMGARDVTLDEHGYVMATVPATTSQSVPTVGFVAHVDTSPEMSGTNVTPIVHHGYAGGNIVLLDAPDAMLLGSADLVLAAQRGNDIVTASGATLLGSDDKAGVAEIMAAAEHLLAHREIAHGDVRIAFTPDEEIGRGASHFDVERFGAACAYTLDGGECGELE